MTDPEDVPDAVMDARWGIGGWHAEDLHQHRLLPRPLRVFLDAALLPADLKAWPLPALFATWGEKRVRVVTASRLGDLGVTEDLSGRTGYTARVVIPQLRDFSPDPQVPSLQDNLDTVLALASLVDRVVIALAPLLRDGAGWGEVLRRLDVMRAASDRLDPPLDQPLDGDPA